MKQPIETAPKDGTWVILFGGNTNEAACYDHDEGHEDYRRPVIGRWHEQYHGTDAGWFFGRYDGGWYCEYSNPTHWAPVPN